jgi:hypothetical protein
MEAFQRHLGINCILLGLVLIVVGAFLSPGGDVQGAAIMETAGAALAVVIYLMLRRQARRSN